MALLQAAQVRPLDTATQGAAFEKGAALVPRHVTVDKVGLTFLNGHVGLQATNLEIAGGEFCTLLGPSGSGKTTLLRTIAGLLAPTSGRVLIGGKDVTSLPVQARNIGFVFQNYALFPHMSVAQNIEYPLKVHKWAEPERKARVREILELIELSHAAQRAVGELSGGQQQRVSVGRALAYRPALLLLDEPMGALDRRLRQQLGRDLREIQQRTGITAVYVTHDQEEAFMLSDRVAIMDGGRVLQYDSPGNLYFQPQSRFVARFLGEANVIEVQALELTESAQLQARTGLGIIPLAGDAPATSDGELAIILRPEDLLLSDTSIARPGHITPMAVTLKHELFLGSRSLLTLELANGTQLLAECSRAQLPSREGQCWLSWKHVATVLIGH